MQIAAVDVIPIRAPRKEVVRSGTGARPVTYSDFGIVRLVTDAGLEGYGEISITAPPIGHVLCHAAETLIAPAVAGLDPVGFPAVLATVDQLLNGELSAPYLRAAFEMALLDITGKHYGIPVYQLLGGKVRDAVPLAWGIYQKSPEEMAADARLAVDAGFQAIKLKVGRALSDDVAAVRAVSTALNHQVPLRLDANMAWQSVPEAAMAIDALAREAPIAWIEQPLARHNLEGLALLRQRSGVPIMADESLHSLVDAFSLAKAQAADVWNVYVVEAGGLLPAAHILALAAALDIPCILGSQAELGIGTAAAAHLGVASPALTRPSETFGPLRYERDIVTTGATIAKGLLTPSDEPGLGLDPDWDTIEAWRVER
ncbi:MAG: mandelate racemase/muconate lactonizing enzyme family protein [Thermomicrobiales bacterium]